MTISYSVSVAQPESQWIDIKMVIHEPPSEDLLLSFNAHQEFATVEQFGATDGSGKPLEVDHIAAQVRVKRNTLTEVSKVVRSAGAASLAISYRVQIGKQIHPHHGEEPFQVFGYLCDPFGLIPGRSIFLLPEIPIQAVRVRFTVPRDWAVACPWEQSDGWFRPAIDSRYLKEELANTTIACGHLGNKTRRLGGSEVAVYVYEAWPCR